MVGATKPFAAAIDIRDMTEWKAERRAILGSEAFDFRCAGAALSYRKEMRAH